MERLRKVLNNVPGDKDFDFNEINKILQSQSKDSLLMSPKDLKPFVNEEDDRRINLPDI